MEGVGQVQTDNANTLGAWAAELITVVTDQPTPPSDVQVVLAMPEPRIPSRMGSVVALRNGGHAFAAGLDVIACPYSPIGDAYQRFAALFWIDGWRRASKDRDHGPAPR